MNTFATKVIRNLKQISNLQQQIVQRTYYAPAALGIDAFTKTQSDIERTSINNIGDLKKRLQDSLNDSSAKIFTEDIKTFLHLVKDDADLDLLIKSLKKYETGKFTFVEYRFGSPLMRLLYKLNKTDKAIELFKDEELKGTLNESTSLLLLLNKLIEEKRYDEVYPIFFKKNESGLFKQKEFSGIPMDIIKLVTEALYLTNTKEAYEQLKNLLALTKEKQRKNTKSLSLSILMAIQNNEPQLAYELSQNFFSNGNFSLNLKAIILGQLKRLEEAFAVIKKITESSRIQSDEKVNNMSVFPLTMKYLKEAAEKSENKADLASFETLSKNVFISNKLCKEDLIASLTKIELNRFGPNALNKFGDRNNQFGERRQFNRNDQFGERRQFDRNDQFGERRQFNRNDQFGERRQFDRNDQFGERRQFNRNDPFGERKQFDRNDSGSRFQSKPDRSNNPPPPLSGKSEEN